MRRLMLAVLFGAILIAPQIQIAAGERQFSDLQVQQAIREALRTRKEQLLRSAYLIEARDEAHITNYLAQQILEFAGKLPEAAKTAKPVKPFQP